MAPHSGMRLICDMLMKLVEAQRQYTIIEIRKGQIVLILRACQFLDMWFIGRFGGSLTLQKTVSLPLGRRSRARVGEKLSWGGVTVPNPTTALPVKELTGPS